jgi:hypothetical protein
VGIENVKLGVCSVTFNSVDLGVTKGGVEVEVTTETHKVMVDQFGNIPINEFIMAREVKVKVPLAETTLANLVAIMPGATLITDATVSTKKKVEIHHATSTDLLALSHKLVLHPIAMGSSKLEDFTIPLAMTPGAVSFAYKLDEERIFNVEFSAYPDSTTGVIAVIGDETAAP